MMIKTNCTTEISVRLVFDVLAFYTNTINDKQTPTFLSALADTLSSLVGLPDRDVGRDGVRDLAGLRARDGISPRSSFWKASAWSR